MNSKWWHLTPVFLPGESHGRRSLVGCSLWGRYESDMTEWLHFHFSLSCIGEGNGNPLHCSCLESPRDRGAWWAAAYGVAQSWTQLKRLSSSSSIALVYRKQHFFLLSSLIKPFISKGKNNPQSENLNFLFCVFSYRLVCSLCKGTGCLKVSFSFEIFLFF